MLLRRLRKTFVYFFYIWNYLHFFQKKIFWKEKKKREVQKSSNKVSEKTNGAKYLCQSDRKRKRKSPALGSVNVGLLSNPRSAAQTRQKIGMMSLMSLTLVSRRDTGTYAELCQICIFSKYFKNLKQKMCNLCQDVNRLRLHQQRFYKQISKIQCTQLVWDQNHLTGISKIKEMKNKSSDFCNRCRKITSD